MVATASSSARPVVDTAQSPHARITPVGPAAVRLSDTFWEPRMAVNRTRTLYAQYRQCEDTGRIDNFRRASGKKPGLPFQGIFFNDSDVYKWLEGAAWSLGTHPDPALEAIVNDVISEIAAAQHPDGYLNTYFVFERASERWSNLKDMHEMYLAGHLIQAGVAHRRATGRDALLNVVVRVADNIVETFGSNKRPGTCGHQEIEMAMVELYRETGDARYLQQADIFITARGQRPGLFENGSYHQDHVPFREAHENTGHAVRQLYYNTGAADVALETGEPALRNALDRLWDDFTLRKMYITGGAGARWDGEAFGASFELPRRAYAETCAAIAVVMWAHRMNALTGEARYIDVLERALYNNVLSGWSLDGERYFYQNPLADRGAHRRQEWFGCACCPPNVSRTLAELPGYFLGTGEGALYVHLYAQGAARATVDGVAVNVDTRSRYPWDGEVTLTLRPERETTFALRARIPAWCEDARLLVNGEVANVPLAPGTYAEVRRAWRPGDTVTLSLPMPARVWEAHPHADTGGRVAVSRGPLVYCFEAADQPGVDPWDIVLPPNAAFSVEERPDLLGGIVVLAAEAAVSDVEPWHNVLYRSATAGAAPRPTRVTAIPYYAWANREPGPMTVWVK